VTKNQEYALFVRNAKACETARHPKCTCACGGKYHGKSHAAVLEELWEVYREEKKQPQPEAAQA
jgi:hypothetical protein